MFYRGEVYLSPMRHLLMADLRSIRLGAKERASRVIHGGPLFDRDRLREAAPPTVASLPSNPDGAMRPRALGLDYIGVQPSPGSKLSKS